MAVSDPALQRLLKAALGAATRRFVPGQAPDGSHISAQPPDAPFDLAFYVDVLHTLFSDRDKAVSLLMGSAADDDDLI